jgi:hypothetical protein
VVATTALYVPFGAFWRWNVTYSSGFVFPAGSRLGIELGRGALATLGFVGLHLSLVAAAALAARRRWRSDVDLWLWVATGLAAIAAGFRFFGHYWLQVIPALVVIATPVLAGTGRRWRQAALAGVLGPLAVAFALLFVHGSFRHRPDAGRVAAVVDANSATGDRVFVWGSYPELYLAADRLPAGKLVHTDFVTGRSGGHEDPSHTLSDATPGAYELMLDDLRAHPPEVVVDTSGNRLLGYRRYPLTMFPDLAGFVHDRYTEVALVEGLTVWRLAGG